MTGILYSTNANQEIYQKRNYLAMIYIYIILKINLLFVYKTFMLCIMKVR